MKQKIIHQIFLKLSDKTMEDFGYDKNSKIWREWCKKNGFRYMLHNESSIDKIMTSKDKQMRNRVKNENRHPFINLDWGKYLVVNHYGGAYVDLDVIPKPNALEYLERPPPILSAWRNKRGDVFCNSQVIVFDKGTLRVLLDYAYDEYNKKSKMRIYNERKIRFYFQVAGPKMICRWARENDIKYQKDFNRFFIDEETTAWMPKKKNVLKSK
jgi:hypothetical protein